MSYMCGMMQVVQNSHPAMIGYYFEKLEITPKDCLQMKADTCNQYPLSAGSIQAGEPPKADAKTCAT